MADSLVEVVQPMTLAMMPFDRVFPEVAQRSVRAVELTERSGRVSTFVFRELYCAQPGCDCRRVLFHVHCVEDEAIAASINYLFDKPKRRGEPQAFLDRMNPQGPDAEGLLDVFREMLAEDRAYRTRLVEHYEMCRQVVEAGGGPLPKPQPRRKKKANPGLELVAAKAARGERKLQQRFRRLLSKVDALRDRLRLWRTQRPEIEREIAAYAARAREEDRLRVEMVRLLDRSYDNPIFTKTDRKKMRGLICELAGELIENGHDELKPIYRKYSGVDFDAETAEMERANVVALKSMMEMFGVDLGDDEVASVDELGERLHAAEAEEAARRAKRKKTARQMAAEARRADEQRDAHKAVQEVYRALARELHPDREQDPVERARKTRLMSEVNVAYEAKDLLRLLELQLELERVDPDRADTIADDRLRHYNKILDDQAKQLAAELDEMEMPFRMELETQMVSPSDVIARVRVDRARLDHRIAAKKRDLETLRDVAQLKPWLREHVRAQPRA